ncbi:BamA/TamA family outer membrane protein [bacterium]|nr:BamA/TamA family outer membrane protein [candidate division CSSED10-310 bacterium]
MFVTIGRASDDDATPHPKTRGMAPILTPFYSPETGWGGVASLIMYWNADRSAARPDTASIVGIYTQKEQMLFGLNVDQYLLGDRLLIKTGLATSNWKKTFFGIGGEPPQGYPSDFEEEYFTETLKGDLGLAGRLREGLYAGLHWSISSTRIDPVEDAVWLAGSDLPGLSGGNVSGPGIIMTWDTRDEAFFPTRGQLFQAEYNWFTPETGSDYDFEQASADMRFYFTVFPGHILALQGNFVYLAGEIPFYRLPSLSGNGLMRGLEGDLYIDRLRLAMQAEYRFPLINRFSGVVFIGAGRTAHDRRKLLEDPEIAAGFGVRYTVEKNKKINLRLDIGFDEAGDRKFYFTLREAF